MFLGELIYLKKHHCQQTPMHHNCLTGPSRAPFFLLHPAISPSSSLTNVLTQADLLIKAI
jgi:hypothetical protein